jgi:MFS family permease
MSTSTASSTDTSRKSQALNRQIVFWAITSALAGFLFGFDTVVISGAEQKIQALWGLSSGVHGFAIASALYGTVLGSLFGGWPTDHFGRKKTLVCIGVLYVISAVGSAFANGIAMFIVARVIGGIGIGISTVAAPLYISEIAPPAYRGRLAGTFQFNIVFGILVAFASTRCSPASVKMPGVGCWVSRRFPRCLPVMCFDSGKPALADRTEGRSSAGVKVLQLIDPDAAAPGRGGC